ncbi:Subtilisin-like protease [Morella rubra]|uniref:Subtilisin-like protease n=1 Tax=Morella rubra TaxID=262757 RepID=A0A6A1VJ88_9ROSI|nr:Subtilisin-like protease [Morella rubra]
MGYASEVPFQYLFLFSYFVLILAASQSTPVERKIYIIQMDISAVPKVFTNHQNWYFSIITSLTSTNPPSVESQGSSPSLLYVYNHAFEGFNALLSKDELESMKESSGYISAHSDTSHVTLETTYTPEFLFLNPNTGLWPASNYGKEVIVGVIDTGIWPESESFKDTGMTAKIPQKWKGICQVGQDFNSSLCNFKLIGARYFNKGLVTEKPNIKISMNSARDTIGHGTHVSSIVAGNYVNGASFFGYAPGTTKGVAPNARLAIYKVLWDGGVSNSDCLEAIDQAISDGVDVISLSLAFDKAGLDEDLLAKATFSAMKKGVLVSAAAGNNIQSDFTTLSNGYPWILTVTASTTDRWFSGTLKLGNGVDIVGWTIFSGSSPAGYLPLVYDKISSACEKPILSLVLNILVCQYGGNVPIRKLIDNLAHANVKGAIIVTKNPIVVEISRIGSMDCPCIWIGESDEEILLSYIKVTVHPLASMIFQQTSIGAKGVPMVASFAKRGPSYNCPCILKPDIMAPGSLVLGAWPPNKPLQVKAVELRFNNFNILSGTSMACPHATGVAALLKGAHSKWSPAAIRSAIMTTAVPFDNTHNPIHESDGRNLQVASPLAMGAGQIDPNRALDPGLIYDAGPEDYMNLLCSMNFNESQIFKITGSKNYNCSNRSHDLNYPSFMIIYRSKGVSLIRKFQRTVTNVGQDVVTYKAKVKAPDGSIRIAVSPQTLSFTKKNEKKSYTLTIAYSGDKEGAVAFGELVWFEENGSRRMRCAKEQPVMGLEDLPGFCEVDRKIIDKRHQKITYFAGAVYQIWQEPNASIFACKQRNIALVFEAVVTQVP